MGRLVKELSHHIPLKCLLPVLTFWLFSVTAFANNPSTNTTPNLQQKRVFSIKDCYGCVESLDEYSDMTSSGSDLDRLDEELRSILSPSGELTKAIKEMQFEKACTQFSETEGLGRWGRFIYDLLDPVEHAYLFNGTSDLKQICPRYSNMNMKEQKHVWVLIISTMSFLESTCSIVSAKGPNGRAHGYLQLHYAAESKYSKSCRDGDSERPQRSFRCGLGMLDNQLARDKELFSNESYWDILRKNGTGKFQIIQKALQTYKICHQSEVLTSDSKTKKSKHIPGKS